jgi:hypothetical protein
VPDDQHHAVVSVLKLLGSLYVEKVSPAQIKILKENLEAIKNNPNYKHTYTRALAKLNAYEKTLS